MRKEDSMGRQAEGTEVEKYSNADSGGCSVALNKDRLVGPSKVFECHIVGLFLMSQTSSRKVDPDQK